MKSPDLQAALGRLARIGTTVNRLAEDNLSDALSQLAQALEETFPGARVSVHGWKEGSLTLLLGAPQEPGEKFPLRVGQRDLGFLQVVGLEKREPPAEDLLANFVNLAATVLSHASNRGDIQRREEDLDHLRRSGLLISSRLGLEDTLEAILEMALEVTGARFGIFRLLNPEGYLVTRAIAGEGMERPLIEALSTEPDSVTGWVAHHRQSVCIRDLRELPWSELYYPLDEELEMRSEVAVPLVDGAGRLEGVLNLESPQVGAFTEQDRLLLQALATQAIMSIGQARLLDILQRVSSRLLSLPCNEVLTGLANRAATLAGVEACIWLVEEEGPVLVTGQALDLHGDHFALPLGSGEEPLGWFVATCRDDWEIKVVSSLAHYATLALENERRQKDLVLEREQRAVAESFAAVGDLSANLLHRLNNKVGIIPVRVDGLRDRYSDLLSQEAYLKKNLDAIEKSAREAMKVVADNFSLLVPTRGRRLDLGRVLTTALEEVELPSAVEVVIEGIEELPAVAAEEHGLRMIFSNLLENASKAMGRRGQIWVEGALDEGWVELLVRDDGPGIPPEIRKQVFEPGFSSGQDRGKLGFGLWWVRTLMARLGGEVEVQDNQPTGACFRLRFPRSGGVA